MNKRSIGIMWTVIALAIILVIIYGVKPRQVAAPAVSGTSSDQTGANNGNAATTTPVVMMNINETASTSPTVTVGYPSFPTLSKTFNEEIATATLSRLAEFRQNVADNSAARDATSHGEAALPMSDYSFLAAWTTARVDMRYVSGIERYDSFVGGANDNVELQTFNYDISTGRELTLANLFPGVNDYLQKIAVLSKTMLVKHFAEVAPDYTDTIGMLDGGTAATADNFSAFTFTDKDVTIYFPKYAVAPGSFGEQSVTISRDLIK